MNIADGAKAFLLGIIEGLTEFIPVSSTGHLLLTEHFFQFSDRSLGGTFAILIQLGAILAILSVYLRKLVLITISLPSDRNARRFVLGVLIAFLPAAVLGYLLRDFIKLVLFNPWVVCTTLILGGLVLAVVDRLDLERRQKDALHFPIPMYLGIGAMQCLAMIPGTSRSGATIVGAMLMGADKRSATEFSFWLAMPTMVGAFALELFKSYKQLTFEGAGLIAIGFVTSFVAALLVVKFLLDYVSRHGFLLFAWWRIAVGSAGLAGLIVFG
jgi:undecaprenyl-diphosphatase